jgi:AP-1 complex subunit gamma-1
LVAFQSSSLRITFNFSKQPGNPQTTLIQATFTNLTPNVFTDFIFLAAVPKVNPDVFQSASFLLFLYHMLYHNIFFLAIVLRYFSFAFGVHLQFLQLHLDPASSNILPASGNGSITQNLRVTNSQHGKVFLIHCHLKLHALQFLDFMASYD